MAKKCPYHVKQGYLSEKGELAVRDVCGARVAQGQTCGFAPFDAKCFQSCPSYIAQQNGGERHVLVPKSDIEYLPEVGGVSNFSEMDLM